MKDIHQKFKSLSTSKKILFYNVYSIILAISFFAIALLIYSLFDSHFEEIPFSESFNLNLHNLSLYIISIVWGFIMSAIALFTTALTPKNKE